MDFQLLLILFAGHYLADYALQSRFMSENKKKVFIEPIGIHSLTAHASIHGLIIGLLSGSFSAGIFVAISHWLIDFVRSSDWLADKLVKSGLIDKKRPMLFGIHLDQFLHLLVILIVAWSIS